MKILEEFNLTNKQIESLQKFSELLLDWNEKFNLTAITKIDEIYEKHFYDSLKILTFKDLKNKTLLDVGTGAGFPGIVLAIAEPKLSVTLLESNGKKITFLNEVKNALKLDNVSIVQKRAEEAGFREQFDIVTARAVKDLRTLLELCFYMVKIDGEFIAYKGSNVKEEIDDAKGAIKALQAELVSLFDYNLPSGDLRSLVVFTKKVKTLKKYPRSYSEIAKRPL